MPRALALSACAGLICYLFHEPAPMVLSLRVGQTFEEVAQSSSFPVRVFSDVPDKDGDGFGTTWVTHPSVIVIFNDPAHGFTLPPTRFATIGYIKNKVMTISTTPMLYKMPFDQAMDELINLQSQFKAGEWRPTNGTHWFDLSPTGQQTLRSHVRDPGHGYMKTTFLVIPHKYEMIFRFYCAAQCDSTIGLDRYLIDIGAGEDKGGD